MQCCELVNKRSFLDLAYKKILKVFTAGEKLEPRRPNKKNSEYA